MLFLATLCALGLPVALGRPDPEGPPGHAHAHDACSPSFDSTKCDWKTECVRGTPFWNTPYQGTTCTWHFAPKGLRHPILNASFRTAYAVNIQIFDGPTEKGALLASWQGSKHGPFEPCNMNALPTFACLMGVV